MRCEIGAEVARSVGGSGSLAMAKEGSSTGVLSLRLRFSVDDGYAPPQGAVALLRESRFFPPAAPADASARREGFWKLGEDDDDGVPRQIQWRLQTGADGLVLGGQTLVPPGAVYFNAKASFDAAQDKLALYDGRITVKEDIGVNTPVFSARGILAEFKIVGTFECSRAAAS